MPRHQDSWGSVVGAALDLVPLVGRVVRDRVEEMVDEGRTGLAETLRDVKDQLKREIDAREGGTVPLEDADGAPQDPAAAEAASGAQTGSGPVPGAGSDAPETR